MIHLSLSLRSITGNHLMQARDFLPGWVEFACSKFVNDSMYEVLKYRQPEHRKSGVWTLLEKQQH